MDLGVPCPFSPSLTILHCTRVIFAAHGVPHGAQWHARHVHALRVLGSEARQQAGRRSHDGRAAAAQQAVLQLPRGTRGQRGEMPDMRLVTIGDRFCPISLRIVSPASWYRFAAVTTSYSRNPGCCVLRFARLGRLPLLGHVLRLHV